MGVSSLSEKRTKVRVFLRPGNLLRWWMPPVALVRQRKIYHGIGPAREYRPTYAVASRTTSGPPRASNSAWLRSGRAVRHARSCQNPKTFGKVDRGKIAFSEWTFGLPLGCLCWLLRNPGFFTVDSTCVDQDFINR